MKLASFRLLETKSQANVGPDVSKLGQKRNKFVIDSLSIIYSLLYRLLLLFV